MELAASKEVFQVRGLLRQQVFVGLQLVAVVLVLVQVQPLKYLVLVLLGPHMAQEAAVVEVFVLVRQVQPLVLQEQAELADRPTH